MIRVKAVSSVYPEDENINNFFNNYDSANLEASLQSIRALRNSLPIPLLNFFPVIFNLLFEVRNDTDTVAIYNKLCETEIYR